MRKIFLIGGLLMLLWVGGGQAVASQCALEPPPREIQRLRPSVSPPPGTFTITAEPAGLRLTNHTAQPLYSVPLNAIRGTSLDHINLKASHKIVANQLHRWDAKVGAWRAVDGQSLFINFSDATFYMPHLKIAGWGCGHRRVEPIPPHESHLTVIYGGQVLRLPIVLAYEPDPDYQYKLRAYEEYVRSRRQKMMFLQGVIISIYAIPAILLAVLVFVIWRFAKQRASLS